jgi:hypothetical protein
MAKRKKKYIVSDGMPEHPKVVEAGGDAGWLHVCALAYCSRQQTDGVISQKKALTVSDRRRPAQLIKVLLEQDLWHGSGHECKRCPQPLPGSYVIHDFTEELGSTRERAGVREAKGLGGAYGNHLRWHAARDLSDPGCEFCVALGSVDRSDQGSDTDRICDPSTDRISDAGTDRISDPERSGEPDSPPKDKPPLPPLVTEMIKVSENGAAPPRTKRQAYDYADDLDFLRFWDAFPGKSGKPAAYRAWLAALKRGADPEVIITAAGRYRNDPSRNPDKTKYPQGWLNDERYNDTPSSPETFAYPTSPYEA